MTLKYRTDGPAGAPALVLGPSLGTAMTMWDPQIPALTRRWRVIRYDLPGHGGSPAPPGPYSVAELAAEVAGLLDTLGVGRAAYCGLSLGGAVGQQLAVAYPERVGALVLCCTSAHFGAPDGWRERAGRVRAEGLEWLEQPSAGRWFTPGFRDRSPAAVRRLLDDLTEHAPEGYAGCCDALAEFDLRHRLGEITAPTRVVAGAEDPATPVALSRELASGIPRAELVVVPDAAHLANVEQPEAVTAAIRGHLEREAL